MTTTNLNILTVFLLLVNPNLDGRWQATSAILGGNTLPASVTREIVLILKEGTYVVGNDSGLVKLLEKNRMEITGNSGPNDGKTYKALYELKGDDLIICYDLSGNAFPESLASQVNTKIFTVRYVRVK
jgi:uncharacterized protein (TIGR03067 family)